MEDSVSMKGEARCWNSNCMAYFKISREKLLYETVRTKVKSKTICICHGETERSSLPCELERGHVAAS